MRRSAPRLTGRSLSTTAIRPRKVDGEEMIQLMIEKLTPWLGRAELAISFANSAAGKQSLRARPPAALMPNL
jgi:hypothetical protein